MTRVKTRNYEDSYFIHYMAADRRFQERFDCLLRSDLEFGQLIDSLAGVARKGTFTSVPGTKTLPGKERGCCRKNTLPHLRLCLLPSQGGMRQRQAVCHQLQW